MEKNNLTDVILECNNISKAFGGTQALNKAKLSVKRGAVHALMGENGAGKSTLMKIIIGLIKADEGEIYYEGKKFYAQNPSEAIRCGISMIHQELNPEPYLSIAENIFLNREDTYGKTFFLNKKATNLRAKEILNAYGVNLNPKLLMEDLTLAQAQMIEIIKAVSFNARLIIMDEPTSSLDGEETANLFKTIRNLRDSGVSVIYISHRMDEVFEICDAVTVFRDGKFVDSLPIDKITREDLISMMVGRKIDNVFPKVDCDIGEQVFRVEGFSGKGFEDIGFEVHSSEILGLAGLVGSGRSETMRAIFGLDNKSKGTLILNGREIVVKKPSSAISKGICMVNEDRKNYGLCLFRSIRENVSLPNLNRHKGALIKISKEKREILQATKEINVKAASIETDANSLSGGNQQKVVLSKWLMALPKVLILDEPTRGVDIGAKTEIYTHICRLAKDGMAIIMVSSELPELMGMCDRILIYHEGRIKGEVSKEDIRTGEATQETILATAFGQF